MRFLFAIFMIVTIAVTASAQDKSDTGPVYKILYVSGTHSNLAKIAALKGYISPLGVTIDRASLSDIGDPAAASLKFSTYDFVVMDDASSRSSKSSFEKYIPAAHAYEGKMLAINWLDEKRLVRGLTDVEAQRLHDYYGNGGQVNLKRMADYLAMILGRQSHDDHSIPAPVIYPDVGIYAPGYEGLIFETLDAYMAWKGEGQTKKPAIGVLIQRSQIESVNTNVIDVAIAKIEAQGALAIPFFFELSPQTSDYVPMLQKGGETIFDVIVNFRAIHWANKRQSEFERLGVPVIQALTYFDGDQKAWEADTQGISPGMTPFLLVLPETAGVIDPVIVAAVNQESGKAEVIDYQMDHLISRAIKYAALKNTPNEDKKLTVFVWGDKNVGASFLNIEESLRSISGALQRAGYAIDKVGSDYFTDRIDRVLNPFYRDYELEELLRDDLAEVMPVKEYVTWFNSLPENVTAPINQFWGAADQNFMVVDHEGERQFVLPRIRNGNLLVMRQPPRSDDPDQDKLIYHKGTVPMNHYYLAAYYYARTYWGSDAIIHLGTHGSQEYLSGKERGLSRYDQSNLAVGDTPVLYPFIIDDVGEAMQAKRRGSATVIGHMTPPFAAAGLAGEASELHELMHQFKSLDEGGVRAKTAEEIKALCFEAKYCQDLELNEVTIDADFAAFLEQLHVYLEDIATQNQPLGLHRFGELPERKLLISTLVQMLGADFTGRARDYEADAYPREEGSQSPNATDDPAHIIAQDITPLEDLAGFKTVRDFVVGTGDLTQLDETLRTDVERGRLYIANMTGIQELPHLIKGLSGGYIPVNTGGDPIRHPESLPSGYNLYGFDPARLPTSAAWAQGKELVEGVIEDYRVRHGHFPDKLAFSLWSIEAMRHYGVLESQALYAMGVKPVWSADGRVVGTEIIPARELKRPRIDVVLSATGLYRDAFPDVMLRLADAVRKVAQLKEANNSIWDNTQRVKADLMQEGMTEEDATYFSTVRLFSNSSGNYGSGVDDAVRASDTWETDAKISDNYLAKMGTAYGADPARWGEQLENVNLYGKQLSGTDVAMLARSSNIYGMISSDDPFEYFGGLALAIRNLDGKSPEMLIANLRDAQNPRAENAAQFLAKELRTRSLNKRWVSEMMEEGYSGATTLASRLTNFWGWQVVDPNLVRDDQWQEFAEVYIKDKFNLGVDEFFEKVNPIAQAEMLERMLEAVRKDYWAADEATRQLLTERLIELVNKYDLVVENEKLKAFVNGQAAGFGMSSVLPTAGASSVTLASQPVQGQQLKKVAQTEPLDQDYNWALIIVLLLCTGFFTGGVFRQNHMKGTRH
ncbi:cobaltochelatase subunit CobN [Paremcibacter congregatus]|nr:cobaltochelatase subunit CobN [Paremcibacter congregatus]